MRYLSMGPKIPGGAPANWSALSAVGVMVGDGCGTGERWDGVNDPTANWMSREKAEPKYCDLSCWSYIASDVKHLRCSRSPLVNVWHWHAKSHQWLHSGWGISAQWWQLMEPATGWTCSRYSPVMYPLSTQCKLHGVGQPVVRKWELCFSRKPWPKIVSRRCGFLRFDR